MATGDILSATINANGWTADVKVEGVAGGGTYLFGMGTNNNPTSARVVFAVTSQGYNTSASLGTKARTVYGVPCVQPAIGAMRLPYPDEADPTETVSGSDIVLTIALSDYIYNDDTATVTVTAGWYTQGGHASIAASALACTNSSALDYPKVIGNWAWPGQSVVHGDFLVEFAAFHGFATGGKQVALCRISATDEHAHTVTYDVTDMTVSTRADPFGKVVIYAATIVVSTLTDGDLITVRAICYPWVGDADSIIDTGDTVNALWSPLYTNQIYRLDTADDHGKCVVDHTNGNDATGAVYATQALAEAGNAFQHIANALTALRTYNNTNAGHNDAGGGHIYLSEDTHILNSDNGGTPTQWVEVEPKTGAVEANVIVSPDGNNAAVPTCIKLKDIVNTAAYFWLADGTDHVWFDSVSMQAGNMIIVYRMAWGAITHSNITFPDGSSGKGLAEFGGELEVWALIRGNTTPTGQYGPLYTTLGNENIGTYNTAGAGNPHNHSQIYAYNKFTSAFVDLSAIDLIDTIALDGVAIVQNVLVRRAATAEHLAAVAGDGYLFTSNNVVIMSNTFAGGRFNFGYNDEAGGPYLHTNWFIKNNLFSAINSKDDVFLADADAIGGWAVSYHVANRYNNFRSASDDDWRGMFYGLDTIMGTDAVYQEPLFVDDNSLDGTAGAGGDYSLQAGSPCIALAGEQFLPFDFVGLARTTPGPAGAYDVESGLSIPVAMHHYKMMWRVF